MEVIKVQHPKAHGEGLEDNNQMVLVLMVVISHVGDINVRDMKIKYDYVIIIIYL